MINNRQNGRRRGRGGPRPQGMDNRPNGGANRPEPRSRGNAPQLHEKYKAMARDAQQAGDRVQTEYYLQFADHYFRILNETRARFDEQRPRGGDNGRDRDDNARDDNGRDDGQGVDAADDYEDEDGEASAGDDESQSNGRYDEAPRGQPRARDAGFDRPQNGRAPREDRPREDRPREDRPREDRPDRGPAAPRGERAQRPQSPRSFEPVGDDGGEERAARPQRPRPLNSPDDLVARPPRAVAQRPENDDDSGPGIDFDRLPPAITRQEPAFGADGPIEGGGDDAPRPARRPRRPREDTPAAA